MLDVHPAHHAASTWKDFFIHIATIVIGLLIAVGLEQTVEYIHHCHQVHQIEVDLETEDLKNLTIIANDIQVIDRSLAQADAAIAALGVRASLNHAAALPPPPEIELIVPGSSAWSATRDSGLLILAPRSLVDDYWKVYFLQEAAILQTRAVYIELDRIQALASLHLPASSRSSANGDTLLVDYANYRQGLRVLKIDLGLLERATEKVLDAPINNVKTSNDSASPQR